MKINYHLENISFLPKEAQNEIKEIFITTSITFFEDFKQLYIQKEVKLLRKKCHTFSSSLMVFNLDECGVLLQNISEKLKLNQYENAYSMLLTLENNVNSFIDLIKKP